MATYVAVLQYCSVAGSRTSTAWSKHEPAAMRHQKTHHWSKMKHKATTFTVKMPEARVIMKPHNCVAVGDIPSANDSSIITITEVPKNTQQFRVTEDGSIVPLQGSSMDNKIERSFSEVRPGSYQKSRPKRKTSVPNMSQYRNPFNDRARQGFKYWPMPRPIPSSYGKYGMGSYKSVLGLGDAVRT